MSISEIECPPLEAFQGERVEITLTHAGSGKPIVGQRISASIRLPMEEQEQRLSSSRDFLWRRTEITNDEGIVALYSPPGTMEITTKIENQLIRRKIDVIEDVTNELRIEVKSPNARLPDESSAMPTGRCNAESRSTISGKHSKIGSKRCATPTSSWPSASWSRRWDAERPLISAGNPKPITSATQST